MIKIIGEAKEDLEKFDYDVINEILHEVDLRLEEGVKDDNIRMVEKYSRNAVFYVLSLDKNILNHKVYFNYMESDIYVFAVRRADIDYVERFFNQSVTDFQLGIGGKASEFRLN
jgi:phage-related protein